MKIQKRHIVLASLMLALSAAVYLNWQFSDSDLLKAPVSKEIGAATYVNADASTSDQVTDVANQNSSKSDYFSKATVQRQQSRDEAIEIANDTLKNADSSDDAKTKAVEQLSKLEDNIIKESNIESLLKAKGYSECMCLISENSCAVSVKKNQLKENSALIIKDIVLSQLEIDFNNITIIEV